MVELDYYTRLIQSAQLQALLQAQMHKDLEFHKLTLKLLTDGYTGKMKPPQVWEKIRLALKDSIEKDRLARKRMLEEIRV